MNDIKNKIQDYLKNNDNKVENALVLRAYKHYCNLINVPVNFKKELTANQVSIRSSLAYKKIIPVWESYSKLKFQDEKKQYIYGQILLLENYMNNLDLSSSKNRKAISNVVTNIEMLLGFDISFPENILEYLEEKIGDAENKKKSKHGIR